ncbi:unnamed protein product, partial [Mesorhabditis spiculigera]
MTSEDRGTGTSHTPRTPNTRPTTETTTESDDQTHPETIEYLLDSSEEVATNGSEKVKKRRQRTHPKSVPGYDNPKLLRCRTEDSQRKRRRRNKKKQLNTIEATLSSEKINRRQKTSGSGGKRSAGTRTRTEGKDHRRRRNMESYPGLQTAVGSSEMRNARRVKTASSAKLRKRVQPSMSQKQQMDDLKKRQEKNRLLRQSLEKRARTPGTAELVLDATQIASESTKEEPPRHSAEKTGQDESSKRHKTARNLLRVLRPGGGSAELAGRGGKRSKSAERSTDDTDDSAQKRRRAPKGKTRASHESLMTRSGLCTQTSGRTSGSGGAKRNKRPKASLHARSGIGKVQTKSSPSEHTQPTIDI